MAPTKTTVPTTTTGVGQPPPAINVHHGRPKSSARIPVMIAMNLTARLLERRRLGAAPAGTASAGTVSPAVTAPPRSWSVQHGTVNLRASKPAAADTGRRAPAP